MDKPTRQSLYIPGGCICGRIRIKELQDATRRRIFFAFNFLSRAIAENNDGKFYSHLHDYNGMIPKNCLDRTRTGMNGEKSKYIR